MTKGGGKPKGRSRKVGNVIAVSQEELKSTAVVGCSYVTGSSETVDKPVEAPIELGFSSPVVASHCEDVNSEAEKKATACKIEEGELPPPRKGGMQLRYVHPTLKQGVPTAKLCKSEVEKESAKWKTAIILYVIGDTPTINYLNNFLHKQCEVSGQFDIFYHNEGYFVVRFELQRDKDNLLGDGPLMIANRPIIIKDWVADFSFEKEVLKEVPLWIRLPKLPLSCWSADSLSRIGSVIGKPVCADECTSQQLRISYARLLVEVDVTKPLIYKVQEEDDDGFKVEQQVYYEWVPLFCQKCHRVGHICKKPDPPKDQNSKQWVPKNKGNEAVLEKGKENVVEVDQVQEEWSRPKTVVGSFQVGDFEVPTENVYQELSIIQEGGDLIPSCKS